ncbi:hypothetical protein [Thermoflexibacter ruber]|uniref:Uncharacterized protein n=1 Tax=Thermoflexibacter ruber TaxID=1003 RepID=A0A1I2HR55_9BACT|nr:hypothetical protein [Thermoflexibacter ruber]SFF31873.1 hypothetical protein SAMN04488541_102557 [Thermoflexibacter ruber]
MISSEIKLYPKRQKLAKLVLMYPKKDIVEDRQLFNRILKRAGYNNEKEFHDELSFTSILFNQLTNNFDFFKAADTQKRAYILRQATHEYAKKRSFEINKDKLFLVETQNTRWVCSVLYNACVAACGTWDPTNFCYGSCFYDYLDCLMDGELPGGLPQQ